MHIAFAIMHWNILPIHHPPPSSPIQPFPLVYSHFVFESLLRYYFIQKYSLTVSPPSPRLGVYSLTMLSAVFSAGPLDSSDFPKR